MRKLLIALILCICFSSAFAQNLWDGTSSTNWHQASNWSLNRVPLASDDVIIPEVPANQPVISTENAACNNLTINSGATLTVNSSRIITLYGNWSNEAGATGFNPGTGTVVFSGGNTQRIQQGLGSEKFYHFVVEKTAGTAARPYADLVFLGNFTLNNGNFYASITGNTYTFHGNVHFNGDGLFWPEGPSIFSGSGNTTYFNSGYNAHFLDFKLDKTTAGNTLTLLSDLAPGGANFTTINKGKFDLGGFKFTPNAEIVINADGKLTVPAGSWLSIRVGLTVNNTGVFEAAGLDGNMAYVYKDVIGVFPFTVNSGGIIKATHTWFTNMDENGIFIKSGAVVGPDHAFNHCSFAYGVSGGVLMTISNNQHLNSLGAHFPANNWGGSHNVRKTNNAGSITFNAVSGGFAGPGFEDDTYDRIHWSFTPVNRHINFSAVYNNETECFDALGNITIQNFWVSNGGSATMIAGESIKFLPNTVVYNGGHLHAYITTTGDYCEILRSMMAADDESDQFSEPNAELIKNTSDLRVSPNPTSGIFSLEIPETSDVPTLIIEVYSIVGELILHAKLPVKLRHEIDLMGRKPGMYFVRVIRGKEMDFVKVVKR